MKIHGTAKGGALSKKDFGVAIVTTPAVECDDYESLTQDAYQSMDGDLRNYSLKMLDGFPMIGCKIASAKWYVRGDTNIPEGSIHSTLYDSAGNVRDTSATRNMSELTSSFAWLEFSFSSPSTVAIDDFISFTAVSSVTPTGSKRVNCGRDSSGAPDTVELWLGGTGSPDDITQESVGRQPTLDLIVT